MGGRRAQMQWFASAISWTSLAAGTNISISVGTAQAGGETIRRMIVDFFCVGQVSTDGAAIAGRVGIIVLDSVTFGAGVAGTPKPFGDGDQEWLWNRGYAIKNNGTFAGMPLHLHDDVRGMRRTKQGDIITLVIQNFSDGAMDFQFGTRVLGSS